MAGTGHFEPPTSVDAACLESALTIEQAIDALEEAFGTPAAFSAPQRTIIDSGDGTFIVMPASGTRCAGAKLLALSPQNPKNGFPLITGVFVLFGGQAMAPTAVIDGGALTEIRTAAVSGLATRFLARPNASRLVVFGAGVQARAHVQAMSAVRDITDVVIVEPNADRAAALVAVVAGWGLTAAVGSATDVSEADIVCTCTTSAEPVFDGELLAAGAHVNAMGAFQPSTREIDDATVRRAWIAVETREAALAEAGDLRQPIEAGLIDDVHAELAEVVSGTAKPPAEVDATLFKSVGVAFEDLIIAEAVMRNLDRTKVA